MYKNAPYIEIPEEQNSCTSGWEAITEVLARAISNINKRKIVVVVECYHGTFEEVNFNALKKGLLPNASCKSSHIFKEKDRIQQMVRQHFQPDQFFNQYSGLGVEDYFDDQKKEALQNNIQFIDEGVILIFGIGASLIWKADLLIYADMSQWEIQQRFKRKDVYNIGMQDSPYSFENQYLWAFLNDWPLCNQIRKETLPKCDYYLETNNWAKPKLVSGAALRKGLYLATQQPFKLAPFFDPLFWDSPDPEQNEGSNFDWCYNCVPEEGNLLFKTKSSLFEVPLLSLIVCNPIQLLGPGMIKRFGESLPIQLDFIDTQDGGKTNYRFLPMNTPSPVTPEQCYYFLEAGEKSKIKLGTFQSLATTQKNNPSIAFKNYDQVLRSHDYLFVPNGTAIRIGAQVIALSISNLSKKFVLEISPKKYLKNNSASTMATFIRSDIKLPDLFVHQSTEVPSAEPALKEHLLKAQLEQLDIQRHWFTDKLDQNTKNQVQIINLIKGDNVLIEDSEGRFAPQLMKRGETYIIPAAIEQYYLKAVAQDETPVAILTVSGNGL